MEIFKKRRAVDEGTVDPKILRKYAIDNDDFQVEKTLQNGELSARWVISVKSSKTNADKKEKRKEMGKSKEKNNLFHV